MNKEINYLKEHLYEIYKYKKSQKGLTYDMDLELLLRTCKALDFIQQENQQLKKQKDDVVEYIKKYDVFKEFSFPLMKKWEENQVKSSIDYQFKESIKKDLLRMLGEIDVKD